MINSVRLIRTNSYPVKGSRFAPLNSPVKNAPDKYTTDVFLNQNVPFTSLYKANLLLSPVRYMEKYVNKGAIQKSINKNPDIAGILTKYGITPKISAVNIDSHAKGHFLSTYFTAKEIARSTNLTDTQKIHLYKASLLHDIGKALIPEEIIQKPAKLTPSEREIVDLHAQIGYEILKPTKVEDEIKEAVRLHHTPVSLKKDNEIAKILSVADVYSALIEERAYKARMSDTEAFKIMRNMSTLSQDYVEILEKRMYGLL